MFNHLKKKNMSYYRHWRKAMLCSVALFIHAWIPCFFKDYTSNKLKKDK
jgi:hypothetical protein